MSKKKPGSYTGGGRPRGSAIGTPQHVLDKDKNRKALARATKAGFASVAEHKESLAKKEAALAAERAANPTPPTFVQRIIANKPLARQLIAERGKDYAPVFDRVKPGPGGVPVPDPELPVPGTYQDDFHTRAAQHALPKDPPKRADGKPWEVNYAIGSFDPAISMAETAFNAGAAAPRYTSRTEDWQRWLHEGSGSFGQMRAGDE